MTRGFEWTRTSGCLKPSVTEPVDEPSLVRDMVRSHHAGFECMGQPVIDDDAIEREAVAIIEGRQEFSDEEIEEILAGL
jgi:hypothetical protein